MNLDPPRLSFHEVIAWTEESFSRFCYLTGESNKTKRTKTTNMTDAKICYMNVTKVIVTFCGCGSKPNPKVVFCNRINRKATLD